MDIASIYSTQNAQSAEFSFPATSSRPAAAEKAGKGDTVNISMEARELFARKLRLARSQGQQNAVLDSLDKEKRQAGESTPANSPEEAAAASAQSEKAQRGGEAAGSGENVEEQIKDLEGQIQQLKSQLVSIMSAPGDAEQKMTAAEPVQQRLQQLEAEVAQLKAQAAQSQTAKA